MEGTVNEANSPYDKMKSIRVSEATRNMARPASREVQDVASEFDELNLQKKEIESLLGTLKTRLTKELANIRENVNTTRWQFQRVKIMEKIDRERAALIVEKQQIEARMISIKDRAIELKATRGLVAEESIPAVIKANNILLIRMIEILTQIRDRLPKNDGD